MDDSGNELSSISGGVSPEDGETSSQKRKIDEWKQEAEDRKRAKSALDHIETRNSFTSLAASMHATLDVDDDDEERDKVSTTLAVPLAQRIGVHNVPSAFISYREDPSRMLTEPLEETEEVQFESQLVDAETQAETQTMIYKRIKLHPHVEANVSPELRAHLAKLKIDEFEIGPLNPKVTLRREHFVKAIRRTREEGQIDPTRLSKEHCSFELIQEPGGRFQVYLVDKNSTNGTKVDGETIPKGGRVVLRHNQTIALLSSSAGTILMGYIVEDPHVLGAHLARPLATARALPTVQLQENVLGVLFAAPLVGKDHQGNSHPLDNLDLEKEYADLKEALIEASQRAHISPVDPTMTRVPREVTLSVQFATSDSLRSLMTLGCRAFHFSGHGSPQHLYFEDGLGTVHPIPISDLKNLCVSGTKNSPLRLVVVQACYSHHVATAFLACGIPHVIAIKFDQKIEDKAASVFTKAFYRALATGKTVAASFITGRDAVSADPHLAHAAQAANKFELLPEGADHSEVIFPMFDVKHDQVPTFTPFSKRFPVIWASTALPAVCTHFCNRTVDQYKVIHELVKEHPSVSRYVWISGPTGIGKTQLAYACCRYMHPRAYFAGGIRVIHVNQYISRESIRSADAVQQAVWKLRSEIDDFVKKTETSASQVAGGTLKRVLVVLDECDALISTPTDQNVFSTMVHNVLTNYFALKLIITATTYVVSDRLQTYGGSPYSLGCFDPYRSADLLRRHISRKISLAELQSSPLAAKIQSPNPQENLTRVLAAHPLIERTRGIPKAIVSLASLINATPTASLDQLAEQHSNLL
ncbi:unnamed protein product [Aphanomyces euteiches]